MRYTLSPYRLKSDMYFKSALYCDFKLPLLMRAVGCTRISLLYNQNQLHEITFSAYLPHIENYYFPYLKDIIVM